MTEATQPDPQVVAWMHRHRASLRHLEPHAARIETVKAYRKACPEAALRVGLGGLVDAYNEAARKSLTLADIPAGQGAASLYLWRDPVSGEIDVFERRGENWHVRLLHLTEVAPALRDHLAATLPHVTAEEA